MAEAFVNVTEGSGKKLHAFDRTIGANTVLDEVVLLGEPYLAHYTVTASNVSTATVNDHLVAIQAGANNKVRIRRIRIYQQALAGAAATLRVTVHRLTAAGSGGGAVTPAPFDTADSAAEATAATLNSVKGTEGAALFQMSMPLAAATPIPDGIEWLQVPGVKPIVIPAGTANGVAIKVTAAVATATVNLFVDLTESSF